jgi:PEP-CTERM motif
MIGQRFALAVAALLLSTQLMSAKAELIRNGGFESGFWGWDLSGNTTGFTFVGETTVHSGRFAAVLFPHGLLGYMSQVIPTVPGETYRLTYWLANIGAPDVSNWFDVQWDGATVTRRIDSDPFEFTEFSLDLLALDPFTTLEFGFRNYPSYWILDDVSVALAPAAVPEPGTLALFGSTLLGMTALRRRRRR